MHLELGYFARSLNSDLNGCATLKPQSQYRLHPTPYLYTWVDSNNVHKVSCWRTKVMEYIVFNLDLELDVKNKILMCCDTLKTKDWINMHAFSFSF